MTEIPPKEARAVRVIHTADWHLGKMLIGLSREDEHTRFLEFLLTTIQQQQVDSLIVAGDIFDSANPPQSAQSQYYTFVSDLFRKTSCSAVIVGGNHDSPAQLEAPRRVLNALRVHVVGSVPQDPNDLLIALPDRSNPKLVVAAIPFLRDRDVRLGQPGQTSKEIQKDIAEGIQRRYDEAATLSRNQFPESPIIATGHLTVSGAFRSESEREIHIGGLGAVTADIFSETFAYVALGHLHRPQVTRERTQVQYSGSPIPLSFSEATDLKEIRLLEFVDGELVNNFSIPIPVTRHLMQLTCRRSELQEQLNAFQPPAAELPTWVEVIVTDPVAGEPLFEIVQEATKAKNWLVVRVVPQRNRERISLTEKQEQADDLQEVNILEKPEDVFAVRLQQQESLSEEERAALQLVFQELLNLHHEQQRESAAPAAGADTTNESAEMPA